ncbi:Rrf2 family transcriptional regulator [Mesorhizobium sp. WSM4976]|uniref:Rrf2 family transcriptional regulator n=1 Tax=Mesorhizobium sp. WSM4976 TaxID=3038549 RepID=UPI0024161304|nr:Rrf2 family transcriptional regulator [Mesorhizobium sp. WSM4976]MDG4892533.1 Rrf2 family transcriptional regulator [Mesorhizobium sp. WSM4976]
MRLTNVSDYASRMLMYTASAGGRLITIEEAPRAFNVSKTHLKEVANTMTRGGYRKAIRGRSGGLVLGRRPEMIRIGDVVPLTEPNFALVECFATGNQSVLTASCKLSRMFGDAIVSFQSTLDRYTLADITPIPEDFLGAPDTTASHQGGRQRRII